MATLSDYYQQYEDEAAGSREIIRDEWSRDCDDEYVSDFVHPAEIRRRREDYARSRSAHQARAHGAIDTRHLYLR